MSQSDDENDAAANPNRTVFMPGTGGAPPAPPQGPPDAAPPEAWGAEPSYPPPEPSAAAPPQPDPATSEAVWKAVMPPPALYSAPPAPPPPASDGRIAVGSVLNHIYEVTRFLARGGMGEVYEGINIQTEERVAIKVILSHLAMDPAIQAMFRKEARTLTRLSHPGLVQYRVLAQEPTLGVLYIVTEFIEGPQLSDVIGKITPSADELEGLVRRLAAGLGAAHELGAIHRDISPDNVLLPEGRLHEAKVIDFGIAKDLDASSKTIVGDGFAGKLGFVAPEQFGDFDREIGPWTDVYSLALVVLAVANGRDVDMGATLVDAIDKRRKGPDLTPIPPSLRPVLEGMLKPNPQERFRSMRDVLDALDAGGGGASAGSAARGGSIPPPTNPPASARSGKSNMPIIAAAVAGIVVLLALAGGAAVLFSGKKPAATTGATVTAAADAPRESEKVRKSVEAALPGVACTWLDIDDVGDGSSGVSLRLSGVAGSPVAAQQAITKAAQSTGAKVGLVDTSNVFPVGPGTCAPLDTFRAFREANSESGRRITSQQSNWEQMDKNPPCVGPNAKVVVDLNTGAAPQDFTILGFDRKGGLQQIFTDRAALEAFKTQQPDLVTPKGTGYSMTSCYNETGLVGEALITGGGPFAVDLPNAMQSDKSKEVDAGWLKTFADKAKAGGWKINMVWYRVVNDQPG